ncbi:MAG: helicase-associated domain-containing protein, partial [Chloroflexota bacterium]
GPDGAYEAVFVPPEIRDHLPTPSNEGSTFSLQPAPAPSMVISGDNLLLDDACTLLAYVHNYRPELSLDQGWPASHKRRLERRLRDGDPARFAFLSHLVYQAGLLLVQEDKSTRLPPEAVTEWLQSDTTVQRRATVTTWRDDPSWNDLFHVPTLQPEDTGAWQNDPLLPRQTVLRHLRACTPMSWYKIEEFVSAIKEIDPDFQRPSGDYASWYIRDEQTGAYLSGFENWDNVEGRLIRYLLTRPMSWLGLVDLGKMEKEQPAHVFRLSEEGAAYIGLSNPPPPSSSPPARLRPGFRVVVPAPRRYARFQLNRVADWVQSGERFVYRLTPSSLDRARQQSIPMTRVIDFLEKIIEAPLPESLEQALDRWDTHGTEVHLESTILLRLSTADLMDQILGSSHLDKLFGERVGPRAVLIHRHDWPEVIVQLEAIGLLPELKDLPE